MRKNPRADSTGIRTFKVFGMDCPSCADQIEKALTKLPGVQDVSVDFVQGKIRAYCNMEGEKEKVVLDTLETLGYHAVPFHETGLSDDTRQDISDFVKMRSWRLIFSAFCMSAGIFFQFLSLPFPIYIGLYLLGGFISGSSVFRAAFVSLKSLALDMNVLMAVSSAGACILGEWLEGALLLFLFSLALELQTRSTEKVRQAVHLLKEQAPRYAAKKMKDSAEKEVQVDELGVGDLVVVKPGEKIPVDGIVVDGASTVNQASMTGESVPVEKNKGDQVFAGTLNHEGALDVRVTHTARENMLSRIVQSVEEAQAKKARFQTFVERFSRIYTPSVFFAALVVGFLPFITGAFSFREAFYRALVLLVTACPCALVISTPVTVVSALVAASRFGVLIKGGATLEKAGSVVALAFDKTGTLTRGIPVVRTIHSLGKKPEALIQIAASLENFSKHPLAGAIVREARKMCMPLLQTTEFSSEPGKGISGRINGASYFVGSRRFLSEHINGFEHVRDVLKQLSEEFSERGQVPVFVTQEGSLLGAIGVSDEVRHTVRAAVQVLRQGGIHKIWLLSGDDPKTAFQVGKEIGLQENEILAGLLPEAKVEAVREIEKNVGPLAMVGDGINDAPALAAATVGIAMGAAGSDVALEAADIALLSEDLSKVVETLKLCRRAVKILKQNIVFSIAVKSVFLLLTFPGYTTLWMAIAADMGASLLVIANGMRLMSRTANRD